MKLTVYGSPLCPDCVEMERVFAEKKIDYTYVKITESMANLKEFLKIRQDEDIFAEIRAEGRVGIPFFAFENGFMTLDLDEALKTIGIEG